MEGFCFFFIFIFFLSGLPFSGDDWFITSHKLMITETTNEIFNMTLYQYLTSSTVPYWIRVQVANDATTAPEWHQLFGKYNNGGYNNQWMVIDYKLFTPGSSLKPNTFVVGEQAPGLYHVEDQSAYLQSNGYWGSYNVPFYPSVWAYSGYAPMYQKVKKRKNVLVVYVECLTEKKTICFKSKCFFFFCFFDCFLFFVFCLFVCVCA